MASITQQTRTGNKGVGGRLLGGLKHGRDRVEDGEALREVHDAGRERNAFFSECGRVQEDGTVALSHVAASRRPAVRYMCGLRDDFRFI